MVEKDTVFKGRLKQVGIFDFKDFYSFAYDWLVNEDYDVFEKNYNEKVLGESKDIEITWEADKKVSDYFKYRIKSDWKVLGMKKVKVKKGEKEVTMDSGQLEIKFTATLLKDYEHRWEDHPTLKFLRGVYDRYIIRARIEDHETKLYGEVTSLINQLKSFLAIEGKY